MKETARPCSAIRRMRWLMLLMLIGAAQLAVAAARQALDDAGWSDRVPDSERADRGAGRQTPSRE